MRRGRLGKESCKNSLAPEIKQFDITKAYSTLRTLRKNSARKKEKGNHQYTKHLNGKKYIEHSGTQTKKKIKRCDCIVLYIRIKNNNLNYICDVNYYDF